MGLPYVIGGLQAYSTVANYFASKKQAEDRAIQNRRVVDDNYNRTMGSILDSLNNHSLDTLLTGNKRGDNQGFSLDALDQLDVSNLNAQNLKDKALQDKITGISNVGITKDNELDKANAKLLSGSVKALASIFSGLPVDKVRGKLPEPTGMGGR